MSLHKANGTPAPFFSGVFRLTGRMVEFDHYGAPYLKIRLSCCDSDYMAGLDVDRHQVPEDIGYLDQIIVSGTRCEKNVLNLDVNLTSIRKATYAEASRQPVLNSIPRVYCPVPESLGELVRSVRLLESTHLKNFVRKVIERKDRLESFINAPASRSHHHSHRGGLLEHSLDVAKNVVAMTHINEPGMPRLLRELGFVAGLLHDVGKTYTYDSKGKPNSAWSLCDHNALTLEACAFGLAYLDHHEPELAVTLRHIWTSASPGARYGTQPAIALARYVRDADGQSAMSNRQSGVLNGTHHGLIKRGRELFWSPSV